MRPLPMTTDFRKILSTALPDRSDLPIIPLSKSHELVVNDGRLARVRRESTGAVLPFKEVRQVTYSRFSRVTR